MQDRGLSVPRVASKEADEIVKGACWALPVQISLSLVMYFLSIICVDLSLLEKRRQIPLKN